MFKRRWAAAVAVLAVAGCSSPAPAADSSPTTPSGPAFDAHQVCVGQVYGLLKALYDRDNLETVDLNGYSDPFYQQASLLLPDYTTVSLVDTTKADTFAVTRASTWCGSQGDPLRPGVDQNGQLGSVTGNPALPVAIGQPASTATAVPESVSATPLPDGVPAPKYGGLEMKVDALPTCFKSDSTCYFTGFLTNNGTSTVQVTGTLYAMLGDGRRIKAEPPDPEGKITDSLDDSIPPGDEGLFNVVFGSLEAGDVIDYVYLAGTADGGDPVVAAPCGFTVVFSA